MMTNPPPITPDEIADSPSCAHLRVMYVTEKKGGHTVGHWECNSCAGRFIPLTVAQREHIDRLADLLNQEHAEVARLEAIERAAQDWCEASSSLYVTNGEVTSDRARAEICLRAALGREETTG